MACCEMIRKRVPSAEFWRTGLRADVMARVCMVGIHCRGVRGLWLGLKLASLCWVSAEERDGRAPRALWQRGGCVGGPVVRFISRHCY